MNTNGYRFFTYGPNGQWSGDYVLIASKEEYGYLFRKVGIAQMIGGNIYRNSSYRLSYAVSNCTSGDWRELKFLDAINLIDKSGLASVLNVLEIKLYSPVKMTPNIQSLILSVLNKKRAFNGDSAFKPSEKMANFYYSLYESKVINLIGGKFYLKENNCE
jgi:hypothetical protein